MTEHGERSPEQDPGWPEFGPDAGPRPCDTGPHPGDLVRTWAARLAALPPRWRYLLLMARIVSIPTAPCGSATISMLKASSARHS